MKKTVFIRISEEKFKTLPLEVISEFDNVEFRESNEYENHKDDPKYMLHYKAVKSAKEALQKYLFNKRWK